MKLLLVSNSGRPFLQHCSGTVLDFLGNIKTVGYITAARLDDADHRFNIARESMAALGLEALHFKLDELLESKLMRAQAVFVSGGNTYALLKRLRDAGILPVLTRLVREGLPYIGTSAGTNLTGRNILATNDWNVVGCSQFDAMHLVPWTINPHYLESDPAMAPGSETRDQRIAEYLSVNPNPVLAIEESTSVWVEKGGARVFGDGRARLFRRGSDPVWFAAGQAIPADTGGGDAGMAV